MRNSWAKKFLAATLQDLSWYAWINPENCLQRLTNARQAGAAIFNPAPEKKETFCALFVTCEQRFYGLDTATLNSIIRNLKKESWALQKEIDYEEDEEKKKKLNEEFTNMEELKRALRVLEAEALYRKKLQQQLEEWKALLKKLQQEIEDEVQKLTIILAHLYANLKNSTDVYLIELEPGVTLGQGAYGEIFALLENVTNDYFNYAISDREFHEKKQDIVSKHVNKTIDNLILRNLLADEQDRLKNLKSKRIEIITDEVHQQVNEKMRADVNYTNAVAIRAKIMAQKEAIKNNTHQVVSISIVKKGNIQKKASISDVKKDNVQKKVSISVVKKDNIQKEVSISRVKKDNIQKEVSISNVKKDNVQKKVNQRIIQVNKNNRESEPYLTSSADVKEMKSALYEISKKEVEESKLLLQKEIKEDKTMLLPKKQNKKSLCSVHDNYDSFFNKEKKPTAPPQPPANDPVPPISQIKKAS